jgi:hypothetical protein
MSKVKTVFSGKRLLSASVLIALIALAIWHMNARSTSAQSVGGFEGAIFTVTPTVLTTTTGTAATPTFSVVDLPAGPFSVQGTITCTNERGKDLGTCTTGTFYRTGIKLASGASGAAVVQDVYVVQEFNGAIMAEGVLNPALTGVIEQANLTAVVGGIGTFRGAIGEMQITNNVNGAGTTNATGTFTARLLEVPRRTGDDRLR